MMVVLSLILREVSWRILYEEAWPIFNLRFDFKRTCPISGTRSINSVTKGRYFRTMHELVV